jgi:CBS domain containing-hemolysin-like protein
MTPFDLLWIAPLLLVLLLLKGFFSGSEIALINADRIKLSHRARQGDRGARLVLELLKHPERLLTTTLVGTNISTVTLTTLGTIVAIDLVGTELGDLAAFAIFTPVLLVLGEIVPKSVYQEKSTEIAPVVVFGLRVFSWVLAPIVLVFSAVARLAARIAGMQRSAPHLFATRDQLRAVIQLADRAEGSQVFDRIRIERAIRFSETTVGEEMVPVAELVALREDATTEQAIECVLRHGYYRMPVYSGNVSNIVGIATISPWNIMNKDQVEEPLDNFVAPAHYVTPYETLSEVLPELRAREDHLAIVVDEFGSAAGLITLQDVFESVVGDIESSRSLAQTRTSHHERRYEMLGDGRYLMDARLPISELNDILELAIPAREFHTLGD